MWNKAHVYLPVMGFITSMYTFFPVWDILNYMGAQVNCRLRARSCMIYLLVWRRQGQLTKRGSFKSHKWCLETDNPRSTEKDSVSLSKGDLWLVNDGVTSKASEGLVEISIRKGGMLLLKSSLIWNYGWKSCRLSPEISSVLCINDAPGRIASSFLSQLLCADS